jgi:hypothetical protein
MYRYLWSNGPKECLEFADYTFEEHFGKPISSYPPRAVLWDYIKGRVEKAKVRKWVRFNTPVRMVTHDKKTKKFTITAHDRKKDRMYSEAFDYVVVAVGHFSTPNVPYFDGLVGFNGRVLHSHDFRDALEFKDKARELEGSSVASARREQDGFLQGWNLERSRLDHTLHRIPASLSVSAGRSAPADGQSSLAPGSLRGRRLGGESEVDVHRNARSVLYVQHVRCASVVCPRRHHGPHQAALERENAQTQQSLA